MSEDLKLNLDFDIDVNGEQKLVAVRREMAALAREIAAIGAGLKSVMGGTGNLTRAATGIRKSKADLLSGEGDALAALKRRFAFEQRMGRQKDAERAKDARAARAEAAEAEKRFRDALSFNSRMASARERSARQEANAVAKAAKEAAKAQATSAREATRIAERAAQARARAEAAAERQVRNEIRETARLRAREQRDAERRQREHERAMDRASRGAGKVRDGAQRVIGYGAAGAAAAGYGASRVIGRGLSSRMSIDAAETNLRIFNDVPDGKGGRRPMTKADILKLRRGRDGLDADAIRNGVSIEDALSVFNEASKAGLQDPRAQASTILKAGSALELDPRGITKLFGTMSRNLGKDATPARLKSVANAIAIAAREDPTQSNEIVEGMNRAQSVLALSSGITEEDLAALVSGGQSAGIQPGKAGTYLSALAKSVSEGGNKFLDPKKRKELNFAAKKLGFGSARDMAGQFAGKEGKSVIYQILQGLKDMAPEMRAQVADALSGGQWSDEDLQMVNGLEGMKATDAAVHDKNNAGFLDTAAATKMQSWQGLWNQSKTIFSLFWESFGSGFDSILREINAFFLDLHGKFNYDAVSNIAKDAVDGLRNGLGFKTWKEALATIFPADVSTVGPSIRQFFTGFGEGLRSVATVIRSVASVFSGGGGAESLGKLAGQFLLLSVAAAALAPVIGIIGGLASIVIGIAGAARGLAAAGILGGGAGAGAAGGAVASAGIWATIGGFIAVGFLAKVAGAFNVLKSDDSRGLFGNLLEEFVPAPLRRWLDGNKDASTPWVDPPRRGVEPTSETPAEKIKVEIERQTEVLEKQLHVSEKALQAQEAQAQTGRVLNQALRGSIDLGNSYRGESPGGSSGGGRSQADGPALNHSVPGGSIGNGMTGMRRRGVIGGGAPNAQFTGSNAEVTKQAAAQLGISPKDLATVISYETGGTFDPSKRGGKGGRHQGLIQFGPAERAKYGITGNETYAEQMPKVVQYLKDRGFKPGMGLNQLYATINGGNPYVSQGASDGNGTIASHVERMQAEHSARAQAFLDSGKGGSGGGGSASPSGPVARSGESSGHIGGQIDFEGQKYDFGSGGHRGANSIPFGTHKITPGTIGPWGQAHGALGIAGNAIWDKTLGRMRTGIEFHAASSASKLSAGCIAIARGQYARFRAHVLDYIKRNGEAYLTVDADGRASITSAAEMASANAKKTQTLGQDIAKPPSALSSAAKDKADDLVMRPRADPSGNIVRNMPGKVGAGVPLRGEGQRMMSGSGGNNSSSAVHAPITINGADKDPKQIASEVQRHIQDSMNRRTHDYEGFA